MGIKHKITCCILSIPIDSVNFVIQINTTMGVGKQQGNDNTNFIASDKYHVVSRSLWLVIKSIYEIFHYRYVKKDLKFSIFQHTQN